jgi:hypothetical protein
MKTNTKPQILAVFLAATVNGVAQPITTTQPANQTVNQGFSATQAARKTVIQNPIQRC